MMMMALEGLSYTAHTDRNRSPQCSIFVVLVAAAAHVLVRSPAMCITVVYSRSCEDLHGTRNMGQQQQLKCCIYRRLEVMIWQAKRSQTPALATQLCNED